MADSDTLTLGRLNYWCREKHWRHMQNVALEGQTKYGNDPVLKFFYAYSLICEERVQEGMRELEMLKDKRDINLCTTMALILAHKKSKAIDKEAVQQLDAKLKEERKQAGEKGLYFAGLLLFHTGKYDKAREYIDRMLKMNPESKEGHAIKGWLELKSGRDASAKKAVKYFDEALGKEGAKDLDALFGKAKYQEQRRNFSGALDLVNQAVVAYPNFLPGIIEKMKILLALQNWEETVDVAQRALSMDPHCLQAQRYLILYQLCREGAYEEAAHKVGDLLQEMDRVEPKNAHLFNEFASVFCRVCGRNKAVLQHTYYMQERAVTIENNNADYVTELGLELLLQGRVRDAMKCYRNAMKLDETSVAALTGVIRCQLLEGALEDAAQQLEFLNEIQQSIGRSAELAYLSAVLAVKKQQGPEKALNFLNEAIETHFAGLKGLPLGTEYLYQLNPDFLLTVSKDYMGFGPTQPTTKGQPPDAILRRCSAVLDPLTRAVPGLMEGLYLQAKVKFLSGDVDGAQSALQHCLEQDSTYSDGHILMAQIHLHQDNFKLANQSLEVGLSYNFEVREHPLYHLIKARILKKQGDNEEAVKTLQMAMALPGVKNSVSTLSTGKKTTQISVNDRVSVYLELAEAHRQVGQQHEAAKVMQDAINEFQGTPEEIRIGISNADLALARNDVEGALAMLRNITPDQPYFVKAREKMAEIYLHHRKDKRLYASCYRELVEKQPSPETCILLGDAYMSIQEPEKAIEVYEAALKKNPKDGQLASKIGQALVKTHNYAKAINYYEAAMRQGQSFLRYDLGELLIRLRHFEKAEKVLRAALEQDEAPTDLDKLVDHSKYLMLLSRVYHRQGKVEDSMAYLSKARDMQTRVLKRAQVEQPDFYPAQKLLASSICQEMGQHMVQQRDYERGIKCYKEALSHSENDGKIMLELAKLYLLTEDLDSCEHQCMMLLKSDQQNDAATVMLADLKFRKNAYEDATYHFQQLLENRPDHYEALARLVDLLRRAGKLEEVPKFLELAENANSRANFDAGFNFCKGVYEWRAGNVNTALKYLNKARKDSEWGYKAACNMIEMCLNPDNDTIGGEVFENVDSDLGAAAERADSEQVAIRTAEKLLAELKPKPGDVRALILQNMALVSTKHKAQVEKALQALTDIANDEMTKDHAGALYASAAAYMVLKHTPRARNQLKRVAKATWNMEDADDLEKSWLLLADIYIQGAKYDMATELLKRCIQYNKSCCKAYEYQGYIMEKEQSFKDASRNYEMAWKYGNKTNPAIGFKLAFNYLKAKRFVDAIDICHVVLTAHPNYPKIRKEILDKSRQGLRV